MSREGGVIFSRLWRLSGITYLGAKIFAIVARAEASAGSSGGSPYSAIVSLNSKGNINRSKHYIIPTCFLTIQTCEKPKDSN